LRLGPADHVLLFTMHHIVSDGWSMNVLVSEIATVYAALRDGMPVPLPPLPIQYADFALWQRRWLDGGELDRQLAYWTLQLDAAPTLDLPTDRPRPAVLSTRGAVHTFRIPPELAGHLRDLARTEGVTLYMLLLAAFDLVLARHAGQHDVV